MSSFKHSCEAILRANDRGTYSVPSPRLYPHQWAWDSAFAAIGWAHVDPARAWEELRTLMAGQWPDGRVPHISFHDRTGDYFPDPSFWHAAAASNGEPAPASSTISQPPVWATATRRVVEIAGMNEKVLRWLLPRIDASHQFFAARRDPLGWGVIAVVHPWESGLDNCPVWDGPLLRVDVSGVPAFERRDVAIVADHSQRPTDEQYLRYAALVQAIARDGYGPGPFAVYDPLVSSILARAEDDLAWLAEKLGQPTRAAERGARIRQGLEQQLWNEDTGRYRYYDAKSGCSIDADVIGSYLPLWCGVEPTRAERLIDGLRERFATTWPLPSTAPSDAAYDPRRYWRGPTWININWLLSMALPELVHRTLALVEHHGFHEYFHPETGEGLGAGSFTWTAALCLDLLSRAS